LTSDRKIKANRANARASTGPKTSHGRARAGRNALRHGLSLPVYSDPALSDEVEALAREIAGTDTNPRVQELARRIAEAQIDLRRMRYARHQWLLDCLRNPDYESGASIRMKWRILRPLLRYDPQQIAELLGPDPQATPDRLENLMDSVLTFVDSKPQGPHKLTTILSVKQLLRFDRYERRALSRRKFAIRAFDKSAKVWMIVTKYSLVCQRGRRIELYLLIATICGCNVFLAERSQIHE
jgi:hypothetical protein